MNKLFLSILLLSSGLAYGMTQSTVAPYNAVQEASFSARLSALKLNLNQARMLSEERLRDLENDAIVLADEVQAVDAKIYSDAMEIARKVGDILDTQGGATRPAPVPLPL